MPDAHIKKDENEMRDYRLIWFQHFHKAAGSSVGALARQNGETFYPNHHNGNPYDDQGRILPLWEYGPAEMTAFIDECERTNTTFVAAEWGAPDFRFLAQDPRVVTVSLLRAPWPRLVSNYKFDVLRRHAKLTPIKPYYFHHSLKYRQANYYTRTLMAGLGRSRGDTPAELEDLAWENLSALDFVLPLEAGNPVEALSAFLGWSPLLDRVNSKPGLLRGIARQAQFGDITYLYRRLRVEDPRWTGIDAFKASFDAANEADIALYRKLLTQAGITEKGQ